MTITRYHTIRMLGACYLLAPLLASSKPISTVSTAPRTLEIEPAISCRRLKNELHLANTTIRRVRLDKGGSTSALYPDAGPQPENCVVDGEIGAYTGVPNPQTGSSDYGIRFQLRMPTHWNGRFFYQGGGAADGTVFPADGVIPSQAGNLSGVQGIFSPQTPALWRGFAVVSTDGGHQAIPLTAAFGVDPQARINYGYASIGQITPVAKQIIATYFGRIPHHSYFLGCSKGGQEAMQASQRYGDQFDGIVAADPGYRLAHAVISHAWQTQSLAEAAHANDPQAVDNAGHPLLYKAFTHNDLELVRKGVLQACDALDGVADGMIFNTAACVGKFDPQSLSCSGNKKSSCLSPAQVTALEQIFHGPTTADGAPVYAPFPYDTGLSSFDGWRIWLLGAPFGKDNLTLTDVLVQSLIRYVMTTPPDPSLSIFEVSTGDMLAGIQATSGIYTASAVDFMDASSTDLDSFKGRGGKIIFTHGTSDSEFSALDTIAYYDQLSARYGSETQTFAKLYLVPGMNHCAGGDYTTDYFDTLDALVGWVEQGVAPTALVAKPGNPSNSKLPAGVTRPLCPYPQYARYQAGNVNDASSYACASP